MIVNIQVRAFSSNKLQLFSYTILEDYQDMFVLLLFLLMCHSTVCFAVDSACIVVAVVSVQVLCL